MTFDVVHQAASVRQRRTVAVLCLLVGLSALLALPVASMRLPAMPHIAGIYGASAAMIDLATFWLLMSAPQPSRSLRIIASAYLFAGLMALLHMLSFPGALLPDVSVLGNSNTVSWLFIVWRAGFPVFILWAVWNEIAAARGRVTKERGPRPATVAVAAVAVALVGALAAGDLPALVPGPHGMQFGPVSAAGAYAGGIVAGVTLVMIYRHGLAQRSLYLWLTLVLISETMGVVLSTSSGGRYTVAWYGARAEGLLASAIVLVFLATHFRELQSRLRATVLELSERTDALQAEIQHRERAERMMAQSQKLEAVGQLAAGLAHDINNFMQVIGMRGEILKRRLGAPVDADVAVIQRNVRKTEQLTRQLLSFAGRRQLQPQTVWLQAAIAEFLEVFRPVLGAKVAVHADLAASAWPVRLDPTELEIALTNLLTNARDALGADGRIQLTLANGPGDRVVLEVRDNGAGIPAAVLERVFEPFFTTKGPGKGSGLGLSQVYAFARASGGDVAIDSAVGRGTTVRLELPRDAGAAELPQGNEDAARPTPTGLLVLLVDDNADVLESTSALLAHNGLVVKTALNAPEALAQLDAGLSPQVLLSDIMLGGMDGLALAQQARQKCPSIHVVLATAYSAAAADASAQGFVVLRKPYEAKQLLDVLLR